MEEWRTVVYDDEVFEGYEVSNMGRVRSLNYNKTGKVQVLKPMVNTNGYLRVCLWKGGKLKRYYVHRLVATAFIENDDIENKTDVNHIDEVKTNNRVENLEWCTREYNNNHGTHNERMAKTRSKKVICLETGEVFDSINDVQKKLGLDPSHISKCCKGKQQTCGGFHWMYYSDYLEKQQQNKDVKNSSAKVA